MKLQGILSSKGRRVAWERNQACRAPVDSRPMRGHAPTPLENGAIKCSCGNTYSPMAFAVHRTGERAERDAAGGVYTLGPLDTWPPRVIETPRQGSHDVADVLSAEQREVLVDAYYAEQRRRRPEIAEGVSTSITD